MTALATIAALVAAAIHTYIFVLESVTFESAGRRVFGVRDDAEARIVRRWAFNQGWYNLFLAVGAAVGALVLAFGDGHVGAALVLFACGSMAGAASVLAATDRALLRPAAIQGGPSAVAVVAAAITLI
ncbi:MULTISPECIES: DUF1304 domain-containing protein [Nocardiaceae]|uniref:DUF1304 domain-containing protein n=1 Tax=Rhodococcoides kroppenstedtii TaxID=293050 RepID=A0ABS7NY53_9NOCA|nr:MULTISPECIES: DUF1304 domain-containing protein [Rhodococcus]MBY6315249.1 DUF1304 domain-containing protein [Rhodococcus kroppenstedtii]MBY6322983.1 DUF1304 domain-containing protein [Rhodococcus kroppenstedtii]MBY6400594.1 DUF1304 domain-containing protein [Rhodococcus kroppenstedtii]